MVWFCLWVLVCASSWTSSVDIDELTFGKNRCYPSQSPSVFWLGLILLKSLVGFPLTFFEVVSFLVVLMTDISWINPMHRDSNNIVCVYLFWALVAFGDQPFGCDAMWIKGGHQNSNSSSIPGDEYWYWCVIALMDSQQGRSPDSEVILLHNNSSVEVASAMWPPAQDLWVLVLLLCGTSGLTKCLDKGVFICRASKLRLVKSLQCLQSI